MEPITKTNPLEGNRSADSSTDFCVLSTEELFPFPVFLQIGHKGFVGAIAWIDRSLGPGLPDGTLVSGGLNELLSLSN